MLQVPSSFWDPGKRNHLYLATVFFVAETNKQKSIHANQTPKSSA